MAGKRKGFLEEGKSFFVFHHNDGVLRRDVAYTQIYARMRKEFLRMVAEIIDFFCFFQYTILENRQKEETKYGDQ